MDFGTADRGHWPDFCRACVVVGPTRARCDGWAIIFEVIGEVLCGGLFTGDRLAEPVAIHALRVDKRPRLGTHFCRLFDTPMEEKRQWNVVNS